MGKFFYILKMKKIIILLAMTFLAMSSFVSCNKDGDDDGGSSDSNIKKGKLSGSSWVYNDSYSSSTGGNEYTFTFRFTSDKEGTATQTGWYQVIDASTWKLKPKQNVNRSQDFTYTYSSNSKEGVITFSSGGIFTKGTHSFSISDDFTEMKMGGSARYKRQ